MKRKIFLFFLIFIFLGYLIFVNLHREIYFYHKWKLGTDVEIKYRTSISKKYISYKGIDNIINYYGERYNPYGKSDYCIVKRLEKAKVGEKIDIDPDTEYLLKVSLSVSRETLGAFDITVKPLMEIWDYHRENLKKLPSREVIEKSLRKVGYQYIKIKNHALIKEKDVSIDLGGIAKGFIIDKIAKFLEKDIHSDSFIINIGGDLFVSSKPFYGNKWKIEVVDPFEKKKVLGYFYVKKSCGIATSGNYERYLKIGDEIYTHIINPATGYPVKNVYSVTVIAKNATLSDAYATALFVMGAKKAQEFLKQKKNISVIYVYRNSIKNTINFFYSRNISFFFAKDIGYRIEKKGKFFVEGIIINHKTLK